MCIYIYMYIIHTDTPKKTEPIAVGVDGARSISKMAHIPDGFSSIF